MATSTVYRSRSRYRYRDTLPPTERRAIYAMVGLGLFGALGLVLTVAPVIWGAW